MRIPKRRRQENKTDFAKRLRLLKSDTPRIIFRKTNRYIIGQYVNSKAAQDSVKVNVSSKELINLGWPENIKGSLKSLPAAYLSGMLLAKKIDNKRLEKKITVDFGMNRNIHKSKIYAFLKGIDDAGIKIKADESKGVFPDADRIKGKHMKNRIPFEEIKSKIEKLREKEGKRN